MASVGSRAVLWVPAVVLSVAFSAGLARPSADVGWLVRHQATSSRTWLPSLSEGLWTGARAPTAALAFQAEPEADLQEEAQVPDGVKALEFGLAVVGSSIAAAGAYHVWGAVGRSYGSNEVGPFVSLEAGLATFLLASPFLSAGGTALGGKLLEQEGTFGRALVGGAIGGLLGTAALLGYGMSPGDRPATALMPIGVILPPLGAVWSYNVWRSNDTNE